MAETSEKNFTLIVMGLILFFVFILPELEKNYKKDKEEFTQTVLSNAKIVKVDELKCSKSCCDFVQWPVPHMPAKKHSKYPINLNCSGTKTSGCVCLNEKDKEYLRSRGNNL